MDQEQLRRIGQRFAKLTPAQQRLAYRKLRDEGVAFASIPVTPREPEAAGAAAPASHAQARQWFYWQLAPEETAYHIAEARLLTGPLDADAAWRACEALQQRHEALRTVFGAAPDGRLMQYVQAPGARDLALVDLSAVAGDEQARQADEAVREARVTPFDLTRGPLWRVRLVRLAPDRHVFVLVMHHIISDAQSLQILIEEFAAAYRAGAVAGLPPSLQYDAPLQYADYAVWQRAWLDAGESEQQLAYWRGRLDDGDYVLALPYDGARVAGGRRPLAKAGVAVPAALAQGLRARAQAQGVTLFMMLLSAYQATLRRYCDTEDVRVGVPIANRGRAGLASVVGLFVNTLVIRSQLPAGTTVAQALAGTRDAVIDAQLHQDLPFEQLVDALKPARSLTTTPLFQTVFNFSQSGPQDAIALGGLTITPWPAAARDAQFDLVLNAEAQGDALRLDLLYGADVFDAATIERLAGSLVTMLHAYAREPDTVIDNLDLIDARDADWLRRDGGPLPTPGLPATIHGAFEAQARLRPDACALVFGDDALSYGELNRRANALAHQLLARGVAPEEPVAILAERSVEMVVATLAVMKAGGAYLPIDPAYVGERVGYMLQASGARWLLTQAGRMASLPPLGAVQALDLADLSLSPGRGRTNDPGLPSDAARLAYVIYTSGSTGRPKGVAVPHGAVVTCLMWMQAVYGLDPGDSVLHKASFGFDVSVWEMFWPLMTGGRLVVAGPGDQRDPVRIAALIERHRVRALNFVPAMLDAFLLEGHHRACASLRHIMVGGDALPSETLAATLAALPDAQLHNLYGPTETTIHVMHWDCQVEGTHRIPIGQPISGTRCYVLDGSLNLAPRGAVGELYVGGAGLARGYLGRPALTAERFVAAPFGSGERLYRTGDLARWREDGELEYLGRTDHQVKIRGFRIELGEIEARLLAQDAVHTAVVVATAAPTRLIAYVAVGQAQVDGAALRQQLAQALPDYMVPAQIIVMPALPLSASGKIDRHALPEPARAGGTQAPPQGEAEAAVARVWREVLGLQTVGRDDNFFELGGDSILSLQVVSRLRTQGLPAAPRLIFEHQTVARLASALTAAGGAPGAAASGTRRKAQGEVPLLPVQAAFFDGAVPDRHHWNQAVLLQLDQPLDLAALRQALDAVLDRHDALRLRYAQTRDGRWRQRYGAVSESERASMLWRREGLRAEDVEALCNAAQRSLDLAAGPLLRVVAMDTVDAGGRLLIVAHHLVVDGVSWRILLEDLQTAYAQARHGQAPALPAASSSYLDWAMALQRYPIDHRDECGYWLALQDADGAVPCAHPQETNRTADQASASLVLDRDQTEALLRAAPAAYGTQVNDVLLTALARALCAWTGRPDVLIDLEGHGREDLYADIDLSRTVGWFTSVYPVRLVPHGDPAQALPRIRDTLRAVPNRGLGYGVLRMRARAGTGASRRARLSQLPRAQVAFNYLGQFDGAFQPASGWRAAPESSGAASHPAAPRSHELVINGQVYGGELRMTLIYSARRQDAAAMTALAAAFQAELLALVAHCVAASARQAHPSAAPGAGTQEPAAQAAPASPPRTAPLVLLNRAMDADDDGFAPLFCLHDGMGSVLEYQGLAAALDGVRTVYGMAAEGLFDPAHQPGTLHDMAQSYVDWMRTVQPFGPYHLLGWSLGGTLAALMAALLEADGDTVETLALVDPYVPGVDSDALAPWGSSFDNGLKMIFAGYPGGLALPPETGVAERDLAAVLPVLEAVFAHHGAQRHAKYRELTPQGAARMFVAGRTLSRAVRASRCQLPGRLNAPVRCWWSAAQAGPHRAGVDAVMNTGAQAHPVAHRVLPASHYDIINDAALIAEIVREDAVTPVSP